MSVVRGRFIIIITIINTITITLLITITVIITIITITITITIIIHHIIMACTKGCDECVDNSPCIASLNVVLRTILLVLQVIIIRISSTDTIASTSALESLHH